MVTIAEIRLLDFKWFLVTSLIWTQIDSKGGLISILNNPSNSLSKIDSKHKIFSTTIDFIKLSGFYLGKNEFHHFSTINTAYWK